MLIQGKIITGCLLWGILCFSLQGLTGQETEMDLNKIASYLALEESENIGGVSMEIDELLQRPVNLNTDRVSVLSELRLISGYQLDQLAEYRHIYGDLVSVGELAYINAWDSATIRRITPLVTASPCPAKGFRFSDLAKGKNQAVIKAKSRLEIPKGFIMADETEGKPHYTGSREYFSFRYDYILGDKIRAGLRLEKDAGEPWLAENSILTARVTAPDYFSGFVTASNIGWLKMICLGNYQVRFGQGINIASGAGIDQGGASVIRTVSGLRPYTSMAEWGYFSGAAASIKTGPIITTLFFSSRKIDPTSPEFDTLGYIVSFSSVNSGGYHRSITEISRKKLVSERLIGFTALYSRHWLRGGITGLSGRYSVPLRTNRQAYTSFAFQGSEFFTLGSELQLIIRKVHLMTEISMNQERGVALKSAIYLLPFPYVKAGISYSHFGALYTNPAGNRPSSAVENSIYAGMEFQLPARWTATISLESLSRPWISYQQDAPFQQTTVRVSVSKILPVDGQLDVMFRVTRKKITYDLQNSYFDHLGFSGKWNLSVQYIFRKIAGIELKTLLAMGRFNQTGSERMSSIVICQDVRYRPSFGKLDLWFRLGLFEVQGYDSRIYLYETDLLFDFTSQVLTGTGWRWAFVASYRPLEWLHFQFKAGRSIYEGQGTTGTGWDETAGNKRTDLKIQMIAKF